MVLTTEETLTIIHLKFTLPARQQTHQIGSA